MTLHVQSGGTIPVNFLGIMPQNIRDGYRIARQGGGLSKGLLVLITLILVAEFSHTISDINLNFATVVLPSDQDTVLSTRARNVDYLYHVVGDPYNVRTMIASETELDGSISDYQLSNSFIAAADSIARGTSPFLLTGKNGYTPVDTVFVHGTEMFLYDTLDGTTLSTLQTRIPLKCNPLEKMKQIKQSISVDVSSGIPGYKDNIDIFASIPNCDFSQERKTGIYLDEHYDRENFNITVTSFARYIPKFLPGTNLNAPIKLRFSNGKDADTFDMPRGARGLARDRTSGWKSGRTVFGITDIVHNNFYTVKLGKLVYANTGSFLGMGTTGMGADENILDSTHEYIFVAEIDGTCPPGVQDPFWDDKSDCLAFIGTYCETFPEDNLGIKVDTAIEFGVDIPETSSCNLKSVEYVYGYNFGVIDYPFLAAVAGVFARNGVSMRNPYDHILSINAVPAALFAMASVTEDVSQKEEVRPVIGLMWILAAISPVTCACIVGVLLIKFRNRTLPVPKNSWELLVLGKEEKSSAIEARKNLTDPFHNPHPSLKYGIVKESPGTTLGFLHSNTDEKQGHCVQLDPEYPVVVDIVDKA